MFETPTLAGLRHPQGHEAPKDSPLWKEWQEKAAEWQRELQREMEGPSLVATGPLWGELLEWAARRVYPEANLNRLSALVDRLTPNTAPDERPDEGDVIVFAHASAALALALETLEEAQTGRYWEVVEKTLGVLQRPRTGNSWYDTTLYDLYVEVSLDLVEAFFWSCLFQKRALDGQYEKALECLMKASAACSDADQELFDVEEPHRIDDLVEILQGRYYSSTGAIKGWGAGYQLVAHRVSAQKAANAFEGLQAASPKETDWPHVVTQCLFVQQIWEEPTPDEEVVSGSWPLPQSARDFWVMARGLALKQLSPDAAAKLLQKMQSDASQMRLRTYFFPDSWDMLPLVAQQNLITADMLMGASAGWKYGVFENLRLAVEALIEDVLVTPFREWLRTRGQENLLSGNRDALLRISQQWQELWGTSTQKLFMEFTRDKYPAVKGAEWQRLKESLLPLRDDRTDSKNANVQYSSLPGQQRIYQQYALFLGIGQPGIIPRLLQIKRDTPRLGK